MYVFGKLFLLKQIKIKAPLPLSSAEHNSTILMKHGAFALNALRKFKDLLSTI